MDGQFTSFRGFNCIRSPMGTGSQMPVLAAAATTCRNRRDMLNNAGVNQLSGPVNSPPAASSLPRSGAEALTTMKAIASHHASFGRFLATCDPPISDLSGHWPG